MPILLLSAFIGVHRRPILVLELREF